MSNSACVDVSQVVVLVESGAQLALICLGPAVKHNVLANANEMGDGSIRGHLPHDVTRSCALAFQRVPTSLCSVSVSLPGRQGVYR